MRRRDCVGLPGEHKRSCGEGRHHRDQVPQEKRKKRKRMTSKKGAGQGPLVFCVNYRGILGSCQLLVVNCQGFLDGWLLTASPFPSHVVLSTHSAFFPLFHWDTGERKPTTREYTSQRVRPISSWRWGGAGGIGSRSQCVCDPFMTPTPTPAPPHHPPSFGPRESRT
jgi:hypothetical protein